MHRGASVPGMISRHLIFLGVISAAALALSACTAQKSDDLARLSSAKASGSAYSRALAKGYEAYAYNRELAGDSAGATLFAKKALRALSGAEVSPEIIPADAKSKAALMAPAIARDKLMQALADPYIDQEPARAAEAVVAFDCWLDLERSGRDLAKLRSCQEEYFESYAALTEHLSGHAAAALKEKNRIEAEALAAKKAAEQKAYAPVPVESTSTIIYFPFDASVPSDTGKELLDEVIKTILKVDDTDVLIHGHADRAGAENYNMALSERRAAYVRGRLIDEGVKQERIQHYGFGESDPKVPTADGVREPYNRRVEIFIQ